MKTFILISLILINGCIPLLIGGGGIVTGYILGNDSASGNVKSEYRLLWDICLEELESMEAEIIESNESKGIIKAKFSDNVLTISINTITSNTQRLKVSVRKYFLPKPQSAQKVFFKIITKLEQ